MNIPQWITLICQVTTIGVLLKIALPSKPSMKDRLINAGFIQDDSGCLWKRGNRFQVQIWQKDGNWFYNWKDMKENCGGGPIPLQNITQIIFYL
jgi:hypothetical protein